MLLAFASVPSSSRQYVIAATIAETQRAWQRRRMLSSDCDMLPKARTHCWNIETLSGIAVSAWTRIVPQRSPHFSFTPASSPVMQFARQPAAARTICALFMNVSIVWPTASMPSVSRSVPVLRPRAMMCAIFSGQL